MPHAERVRVMGVPPFEWHRFGTYLRWMSLAGWRWLRANIVGWQTVGMTLLLVIASHSLRELATTDALEEYGLSAAGYVAAVMFTGLAAMGTNVILATVLPPSRLIDQPLCVPLATMGWSQPYRTLLVVLGQAFRSMCTVPPAMLTFHWQEFVRTFASGAALTVYVTATLVVSSVLSVAAVQAAQDWGRHPTRGPARVKLMSSDGRTLLGMISLLAVMVLSIALAATMPDALTRLGERAPQLLYLLQLPLVLGLAVRDGHLWMGLVATLVLVAVTIRVGQRLWVWAQQPILMFQWDAQVAPVQYANAFGRRWRPANPAWRRVVLFAIKDLQLVGRPMPTGLARECGMVISPVMFYMGLRAIVLPPDVDGAGRIAEGLAAGLGVVAVLAARRGLGCRGLESHQWYRLAPVLGFRELVSIKMRIAAGYTAALGLVLPAALLLWPSVLQPELRVPGAVVLVAIPLGVLAGAVLGVTGTAIGMLVPGAPTGLLMPGASRTGLLLYGLCSALATVVWVGAVTVWALGLVPAAGLMGACVGVVVCLLAVSAGALAWAAYRFQRGPK